MQLILCCPLNMRQDTPLIHFQHEQAGACLRASEVKPQLDRFIQEYLRRRGSKDPKSWYAAQSKTDAVKALAYKPNISCRAADTVTKKPYKLYFGNMVMLSGGLTSTESRHSQTR